MRTRASLLAARASSRSSFNASASHIRPHIRSLIAPMTTKPSAAANAEYGTIDGWPLPQRPAWLSGSTLAEAITVARQLNAVA